MQDPRLQARLWALQKQHDLSDEAVSALADLLGEIVGASTLVSELDPNESAQAPSLEIDGRYAFLEPIGRGGTGEVWRVLDQVLGRTLALKVLHAGPRGGLDLLAEAKAAARLRHPAIVTVHDVGVQADGRMYYTMEEVDGYTLLAAIAMRTPGPVDAPLRRLLQAIATVGQGLAYAHDNGVVHRDVKPQNIMLGTYGEVRLLDFGVGVLGTPAYLAPELLEGQGADSRTDQYSLGATLYHAVAGHPAYGGTSEEVLEAVRTRPPTTLQGPPGLVAIAERAMARDPADRYANCADLSRSILDFLDGVIAEQRARELLADASQRLDDIKALREDAAALLEHTRTELRAIHPHEPVSKKKPWWDQEEQANALASQAEHKSVAVLQTLRFAEREAPRLAAVHEALADYWHAEHLHLESVGNPSAPSALSWLALHDRGSHAAYLKGDGAVTLRTTPSGADVHLFRIVRDGRRLRHRYVRSLGQTPLLATPVPHGDYVLLVSHEGGHVRIPVQVERLEHIDVQGFGEPLPLLGRMGPQERYIPAGWAQFGSEERTQLTGMPPTRAWLDGFVMQRFPVTNRNYLAFLDALVADGRGEEAAQHAPMPTGGSQNMVLGEDGRHHLVPDPQGEVWQLDWPVFEISWFDARAYATWLAHATGQPWRLPGELEWEKAARGVDGRRYPWGDEFEATWCNMRSSHRVMGPRSVRDHPVDQGPYGVRGLSGNLSDWCQDRHDPEGPSIDDRGRWHAIEDDSIEADLRLVRGGCWAFNAVACVSTYRLALRPDTRRSSTSFRLVRSVTEPD